MKNRNIDDYGDHLTREELEAELRAAGIDPDALIRSVRELLERLRSEYTVDLRPLP